MAENSAISWCHHTLNFWIGCTKVSPACDFCYAEIWANRWPRYAGAWDGERFRTAQANWRKALKWNADAKAAGERHRVFSNSLSDFFDNQVDPSWRAASFEVIEECDGLDWLLLTKRPQNIAKMLPPRWPLPNVWLGITAEDQPRYDQRMPHLAAIDCAKRFVSHEPALGELDLLTGHTATEPWAALLDLVIMGGESGPHARPTMTSTAFRSVRDQCRTAGIWFHGKQWGEWIPADQIGWLPADYSTGYPRVAGPPGETDFIRVGVANSGNMLDGVSWQEMPP